MGDEVDEFNLPQHQSQSGNFDSGHISQLAKYPTRTGWTVKYCSRKLLWD